MRLCDLSNDRISRFKHRWTNWGVPFRYIERQNWQKIVLLHVSGHFDNRWIFDIHIEQLLDMGRNKDARRFDHPGYLSNSVYYIFGTGWPKLSIIRDSDDLQFLYNGIVHVGRCHVFDKRLENVSRSHECAVSFVHPILVVLARVTEMVVGKGSVGRGERYIGTIGESKWKRVATFFHAKITATNDDVTVQK